MLIRKQVVVQSHVDPDTHNLICVPFTELVYIPLV